MGLKKITWTKPRELFINFMIVVMFSAFMALSIYGIDMAAVAVQRAFLSLF